MSRWPKQKLWLYAGICALAIVTILIRVFALHMYDIHIDEITYEHFAKTIDHGGIPRDYANEPFFLHPPGYFALLGIWRALFWHGGSIFAEFTVLRMLNVVLAGLTVIVLFNLVRFLTKSPRLGFLAGALFALDPFIIRQNTRSLMETSAELLYLTGVWLLMRYCEKSTRHTWMWYVVGVVFGLAVVTKDVTLNLLLLTLILMALRKVGPKREAYKYLIPGTLTPYALWVMNVLLHGDIGAFIHNKALGVQRFFGLLQTTGFNSSASPSKNGTLLQTIPHYASSYVIMGIGVIAAFWLLSLAHGRTRRWGAVAGAASLLLVYLYIGGTFEEQYLYYLIVPSIITIIVAGHALLERIPAAYSKRTRIIATCTLALIMAFNIISYVKNVSTEANGWQTTITWANQHVPANSRVCVYAQGEFLLDDNGYDVCSWSSAKALTDHRVQYVIISDKLAVANYAPLGSSELAKIRRTSNVAFRYTSQDSGKFEILKINPAPTQNTKHTQQTVALAPTQQSSASVTPSDNLAPLRGQMPTTLVKTGFSLGTLARIFISTTLVGTALSYLYLTLRYRWSRVDEPFVVHTSTDHLAQVGTLAIRGAHI